MLCPLGSALKLVDYELQILNQQQTGYSNSKFLFSYRRTPNVNPRKTPRRKLWPDDAGGLPGSLVPSVHPVAFGPHLIKPPQPAGETPCSTNNHAASAVTKTVPSPSSPICQVTLSRGVTITAMVR